MTHSDPGLHSWTMRRNTEVLRSGGTSPIGLAVHATRPASGIYGATF
jgi:hypothetical protein